MQALTNPRLIIAVLVLASTVSIMSTDLYTPSLPHLPAYFDTTPQAVKLTITLNILFFGLSQLLLGPLSDRVGRRPIMLLGLAVFTLCSSLAAMAPTIGFLLVARCFQGTFASVEAVVGLAVIRDLFDDTARVKALAIWGMALAVAPAAAPILGGYIHVGFGWRANFWLVAALGLATTLLIWRVLPESTEPDPGALSLRSLRQGYGSLLRNRTFLRHALMLGTSLGAIFAFITAGPFVLITRFGVATEHYGFYQAVIVAAFFLGSLAANRLAGRMRLDRLLGLGLVTAALGGLGLPVIFLLGALGPNSMTAALGLLAFGLGPIFAVSPAQALASSTAPAGYGSALLGSTQMLISAFSAAAVTVFHDGTPRPLVFTVCALVLLAGVGWRLSADRAPSTAFR